MFSKRSTHVCGCRLISIGLARVLQRVAVSYSDLRCVAVCGGQYLEKERQCLLLPWGGYDSQAP